MPLSDTFVSSPATFVVIALCSGIWFYIWNKHIGYPDVGFNYDLVVKEGQVWRVITSSFSHVSIMHLVFNMYALYTVSDLETFLPGGSIEYMKASFVIMILSEVLITIYGFVMITFWRNEAVRRTFSLGYSCVVFGMMTLFAMVAPGSLSMFGLPVPRYLAPFVSLAITQMIVPQASFVGHFAGIVIGFMYYFELFTWFTNYLFMCSVFWTVVLFIRSVKVASSFPLPCIQVEDEDDAAVGRGRMENGRLVWSPRQQHADELV